MKKGVFVLFILVLAVCEVFTVKAREDLVVMEQDANESYTEYSEHKNEYTITNGTITEIPTEGSGNGVHYCFIEFTTSDGHTYTDRFFPCDTDSDKVGGRVEIAYRLRNVGAHTSADAARTEYIANKIPLRTNRLLTIGFAAGIGVLIVCSLISARRD